MNRKLREIIGKLYRSVRRALRYSVTLTAPHAKKTVYRAKRGAQLAHHHAVKRPHAHMLEHWGWYARWHNWRWHQLVHGLSLGAYFILIAVVLIANVRSVFAADLTTNWDFSNPSDYSLASGVEVSGTSARLKAQNYTTDADTAALYHLDESTGSNATDSSANSNTMNLQSSPSWSTGNLNNGLSLNGTTQYGSANDSASLSLTGNQTIEGWFKPSTTFNNNSNSNQVLADKGSYRVGLDRTSGKMTYEIQNNSANTWTKQMGGDLNGSWSFYHYSVDSSVADGSNIYAGVAGTTGDGEVWKWNGTTWTKIGGDGVNGSWADAIYESVTAMAISGNTLFAGLGTSTGDGDVYSCNIASNCTSWTKIGGDGTGWAVNATEAVRSMSVVGSTLYVGLGDSAGDADVWKYNGGSSWTQVGGDGLNSGWAASTFEQVMSMTTDGTTLYAGLGNSTLDAEVWSWNGTTWTKIGGDGVNSGWNTSFETVVSMTYAGSNLYAGLGTGSSDAEVWRWNGSSWTKIGGGSAGANSSWSGATPTSVQSMTTDGTNIYAGLLANNASEVWKWNGSAWSKIGGAGLGGTWNGGSSVSTMAWYNSKLFVVQSTTGIAGSSAWDYNGSTWTAIGGQYINNSWGVNSITTVTAMTPMNGKMYVALGDARASATVWEWDGSTARLIGGAGGVNSSWGDAVALDYEGVYAMTAYKGELYVGLGNNNTDGEVWKWNGSAWSKIGGDSVNSSWSSASQVSAMTVYGGKLVVGLINDDGVWTWDGSTWTRIGGGGTSNNWSATVANIFALVIYENKICASTGYNNNATYNQVWCYNNSGTSWTQIGGYGVAGSWSTQNVGVLTMTVGNGKLYASVTDTTSLNPEVWQYDGSTWTKIGGNGTGWDAGTYTHIYSSVIYNGELYVGTGNGNAGGNGAGDVFKYNGSTWSQVGGDNINNSWGSNIEFAYSMTTFKGKLYLGTGYGANADTFVYSYGNNGYAESSNTSFNTSWHHFAVSYDGTTMKMYIDGSQVGTTTVGLSGVDNSLPLLIGKGYGSWYKGDGQSFFSGDLDEFRISSIARTSFTTKPYATTAQGITLGTAVRTSGVKKWDGLASSETANGGTVTYRLSSDDGTTWKYWTGSTWATSNSSSDSNAIATINSHIDTFPVTFDGITWQAFLLGDGTQRVQLNSVTLSATSDTVDPNANASNIVAFRANGGSLLASNDWTNGSSPYFTWDAATDAGSGILGYCLYLGQSSSADPATTKGILGTSNVDTGGACQFAVSNTNVDLSTPGSVATPLATSNTPYYLNIKAIDRAGNLFGSSEQFQFRFDNTVPTNPGFVSAPSSFINTKTATLTWPTSGAQAADDAQSGVVGLQYRIGSGGSWYGDDHIGSGDSSDLLTNDGSYTTVDPPDFDDLTDGVNTIYFRTWDAAGNVTTSYTTAALKINTTGAPSEPQNLSVTPASNTSNSFAFSWDAPATFNSSTGDADKLSYCYTVNTLPNVSNCTFTSQGQTSLSAAAFATQPGSNTFYVVGKDDFNAINYSSYASITFTANTPAPGMPLNADIADVSVKATSNWRLAVTWDEPSTVGAGIATYRLYRSTDNNSFSQVGTSSSTSYVDSGLSQQRYYYKVRACDSANNCGAESSVVSFIPTGKFTSPANATSEPKVTNITTKKASISWSTDRASDSKVSIGTKSGVYSPSEVGNSSQTTDHELDLDNLAAGTTYYFIAKWTDEDGNTGSSQEYTFVTAPAPLLKEVNNLATGLSSSTIQFTTKDAVKVDVNFGKSDAFGGVKSINTSSRESTYEIELNGLDDGSKYFYKLTLYDSEGGAYGSSIFSFSTPPRPRISELRFQPVEGEPTSTQRVTWQTNVATTTNLNYGKIDRPAIVVETQELKTTHEVVIRNLEDESEYYLIAQGRDANGNLAVSDKQVFKTALDTRPPGISEILIEPTIRGTGAEARGQIVVSWRTDEPSTSQVAYAEGSNTKVFNNRTAEDAQLTTEHLVIVSDLPTSKVYSIAPISKDKAGNITTADPQAGIIGRASDSVLNIVLNTLQKVFGF